MRRLLLLGVLGSTACWDFSGDFEARCRPSSGSFVDKSACTGDGGASSGGFSICSKAGWCWEHPAQTTNPLYAVWGDDSKLSAVGAGNIILHFDGTTWTASPLVPAFDGGLWFPEPVVTGSAVDDAGLVWLVGENMPLLVSDGGAFEAARGPELSVNAQWDSVTTWRGTVSVIRNDPQPRLVSVGRGASGALGDGLTRLRALFVDDEVCAVTAEYGSQVVVAGCLDGGLLLESAGLLPDGGNTYLGATARLRDGGLVVGATDENWWQVGPPPTPLHFDGVDRFDAWARTRDGLLVCGVNGFIFNLDTQESIRPLMDATPTLHAAWASPSDTFWAVGEGGSVVRTTSATTWASAVTEERRHLRAGWVDDTSVVAVAQDEVFERRDGRWVARGITPAGVLAAAAKQGDTLYLLNQAGSAYRLGPQDLVPSALGTLAAPFNPYIGRASAVAVTPDGGVLFGSGSVLARRVGDGLEAVYFPALAMDDQIIAIATTATTWLVGTRTSVLLSEDEGGSWRTFPAPPNTILSDVAACPDGRLVASGDNGQLVRLNLVDGGTPPLLGINRPESFVSFVDLWCAPDGTLWTINTEGLVHRVLPDGGVLREPTGWGARAGQEAPGAFIGGNAERVYLFGSFQSILSRPLP